MADDVVRAPVIGRLLWRSRRLLAVLAAFGAALGVLAWFVLPQSFTATTKVLLQGASEESEISTAAQIAMGRVVVQRAVAGLGWQPGSVDEDAVSAEATQGSVVMISATADGPERARALAARVAKEYIEFSTEVAQRAADAAAEAFDGRREELQRQINELDDSIGPGAGSFASSTEGSLLSTRRTELLQALHDIEQQIADARAEAAVGEASLQVIEPAELPETSSTPTLPILVAGGAALAVAVGAATLTSARLGDRRLRRRTDIAAALGAPVLGTVAARTDPDGSTSRFSLLGWLLGTSGPASFQESPGEQRLELLRYSRLLERLHGVSEAPPRIAVVTADGDDDADRAIARLVGAAEAGGRSLAVLGEGQHLAGESSARGGDGTIWRAGSESPAGLIGDGHPHGATLRVVTVPPARPTVPRDPVASGALIVTTSGTRTHWELLAVAEACRDALLPVLGALVVVPVGYEEEVEAASRITAWEPANPAAARMNGHANGTKS